MTAPPDVSLSYNFITKGQPKDIAKAIDSIYGALYKKGDECIVVDTGSTPRQLKTLRKVLAEFPNLHILYHPELSEDYKPLIVKWLGKEIYKKYKKGMGNSLGVRSFAAAREVARKASINPFIFWADSDDILVEEVPGRLREVINMIYGQNPRRIDSLLLDYQYNFSEDGKVTTLLRRERVVPRETYHWVGYCHEVAIPQPGITTQNTGYFADLKSHLVHTDARKAHFFSDVRNYILLRKNMEDELKATGFCDPRTLYYLGNSARGLRKFREAIRLYAEFNRVSGSADDRYAAQFYTAGVYLDPKVNRPFDAVDTYLDCMKIKPDDPRAYFGLQRAYYLLQRFQDSFKWFQIGSQHSMPDDQLMSYDPLYNDYHPYILAAFTMKELGNNRKALEYIEHAARVRPEFDEAKDLTKIFQNNVMGTDLANAVHIYAQSTKISPSKLVEALEGIPEELEKAGLGKVEQEEGRADRPNVALFCGPSGEQWSAASRKTGIGGSEKMVITLADSLQRSGKVNVSVFADVSIEYRGVNADTGVAWYHWSQMDPNRPREAVVFWRNANFATQVKCIAKTRIMWCHDVQHPDTFTPEILANLDYVQVQSDFHADPIREVVGDKLWIARNGIEIPHKEDVPRDPKQVVYCSSPDRGLQTAAKIIRQARKIDPEISFVVTYGVTPWARKAFAGGSHRFCPDVGHQICMDLYERETHQLLDEIGATNLGRIGFKEMEVLFQTSGVWLYPTRFHEISCMSAMEAQINGCACLATRHAALTTTLLPEATALATHIPHIPGCPIIPEEWIAAVAKQLVDTVNLPVDHPARAEQTKAAIKAFNIDDLANSWLTKLGFGEDSDSAAGAPLQKPVVPVAGPLSKFTSEELKYLFPDGVPTHVTDLPAPSVMESILAKRSNEQAINFFCGLEKAQEILESGVIQAHGSNK